MHLGDVETVGLVAAEDLKLLVPALSHDGLKAEVIYTGPFTAPIAKGTVLAELVIQRPDLPEQRVPLVAEADVAKGGFLTHLSTAARQLKARYWGDKAPAS